MEINEQNNSSSASNSNESDFEKEDLKIAADTDSKEEKELPPPEDKESQEKELNVTNIFGVILIGFIFITLVILIITTFSKKKKIEEKELAKINSKSDLSYNFIEPEIEIPEKEPPVPDKDNLTNEFTDSNKSEIPEINKNENKAPEEIKSVGSGGISSTTSDRPDTRNSKSTRNINGLIPEQNHYQYYTDSSLPSVSKSSSSIPSSSSRVNPYTEDYKMNELARIRGSMSGTPTGYSGSDNKQSFYDSNLGNGGSGSYLSEYSIWDGTIIPGALITAINTDNPGVVIARVTENVYSSKDASYLLIPEGSLLYATYNSSVSYGQNKVQVAWNLLIRPDGYRVELGNMNGVDPTGYSGYKGYVNNHPFETLKALGLVAVYSLIQTEISNDINEQENEYLKNTITDVYAQASSIGNRIVNRALDIKPTITIPQGKEIKLITNIPLNLPPVEINKPNQKYIKY